MRSGVLHKFLALLHNSPREFVHLWCCYEAESDCVAMTLSDMRFMSSFVKIRLVAQNLNLTEKYADLILNGKLILVCKVCVSEC